MNDRWCHSSIRSFNIALTASPYLVWSMAVWSPDNHIICSVLPLKGNLLSNVWNGDFVEVLHSPGYESRLRARCMFFPLGMMVSSRISTALLCLHQYMVWHKNRRNTIYTADIELDEVDELVQNKRGKSVKAARENWALTVNDNLVLPIYIERLTSILTRSGLVARWLEVVEDGRERNLVSCFPIYLA